MAFLFGKGGSKENLDQSGGYQGATVPEASAGKSAGGDMFGGLSVAPRRRGKKGGQTDTPDPQHVDPNAKQPSPSASDAGSSAANDRLKKRLHNFYEKYNPSKISTLGDVMKKYAGREDDLFHALVAKYGPEPKEEEETADTGSNGGGAFGFGDSSNGGGGDSGGFGFVSSEASPDAASGWGAPSDPSPNGGFGFVAAAGFGEGGATSTFGFVADDGEAGTEQPATGGFGFVSDTAASDEPASTGFGFVNSEAAETTATESDPAAAPADWRASAQPGSASPQRSEPPPVQSEDVEERLEREAAEAESKVKDSRSYFDGMVQELLKQSELRKAKVAQWLDSDAELQTTIAAEDFVKAEELNEEIAAIGSDLKELDDTMVTLADEVQKGREDLSAALKNQAAVLSSHKGERESLHKEKEQKLNKYWTETQHRLEVSAEAVNADLEKATRTMNNLEQEVINLQQREAKINERITEQTSELHTQRDDIAKDKEKLEVEIKELEALLTAKRKKLAEKSSKIKDLDGQMKVIYDEHAEAKQRVASQMKEEESKLRLAKQKVEDLTEDQQKECDATEHFQSEKAEGEAKLATMSETATELNAKVERIEGTLLETLAATDAILRSACAVRQEGLRWLLAHPHVADDTADVGAEMETQLKNMIARDSFITSRISEIGNQIPALEAAKKRAAQSKMFKEAQANTEQIKKVTAEREALEAERVGVVAPSIASLREQMKNVEGDRARQRQEKANKLFDFKTRLLGELALLRTALEAEDSDTGSPLRPLLELMEAEANALELPEGAEASSLQSPLTPPSPNCSPASAQAESFPAATAEEPELSQEDIKAKVEALEAELKDAMDAEEYDKCETIQNAIDDLNAKLE